MSSRAVASLPVISRSHLLLTENGFSTPLENILSPISNKDGSSPEFYYQLCREVQSPTLSDQTLVLFYQQILRFVHHLDGKFESLVGAALNIDWLSKSQAVAKEYVRFVLSLLQTTDTYHKAIMRVTVQQFSPKLLVKQDEPYVSEDNPPDYDRLHYLLADIVKRYPVLADTFIDFLRERAPMYFRHCEELRRFVSNSLKAISYLPMHRSAILDITLNLIIHIDARSSRESIELAEIRRRTTSTSSTDVFQMQDLATIEINQNTLPNGDHDQDAVMAHLWAEKLDVLLDIVFEYLNYATHPNGVLDKTVTNNLYNDLMEIFTRFILTTQACSHIQFLYFYLCSLSEEILRDFLDRLWHTFQDPNAIPALRSSAAAYIGSLLARGKFISSRLTLDSLSSICEWIHSYLKTAHFTMYHNGRTKSSQVISSSPTTAYHHNDEPPHYHQHAAFYTICQTVFYIIVFKHKQLLKKSKGRAKISALNLNAIVMSPLNPLQWCLPVICHTFSAVMRNNQLLFCDNILERNQRRLLVGTEPISPGDSYFPFDPCLLKRCSKRIDRIYRHYDGSIVQPITASSLSQLHQHKSDEHADDFLDNIDSTELLSSSLKQLLLGTSNLHVLPNFEEQLPMLESSISSCDFIAIDAEFSGLFHGVKTHCFDTVSSRYKKTVTGSSDFGIIQFGISCFVNNGDNSHTVDSYVIPVFPREFGKRKDLLFCAQASSLEFLADNGFDFNNLLQNGVSFLTEREEAKAREELEIKLLSVEDTEQPGGTPQKSRAAVPEEHKKYVADISSELEMFVSETDEEKCIEQNNPFLRKLIYQLIGDKFSDRLCACGRKSSNGQSAIVVTRLSSGSKKDQIKRQGETDINTALGFSRIIRILTASNKIIVGHNMLLDIFHVLKIAAGPLPNDYEEFRLMAQTAFPYLLDTKTICYSFPDLRKLIPSSVLSDLYSSVQQPPFVSPNIKFKTDELKKSLLELTAHNAAYDSYITGVSAIALCTYVVMQIRKSAAPVRRLIDPANPSVAAFLNKIFVTRIHDISFIDLTKKEEHLSREHVFHLSFPATWRTDHIEKLFEPFSAIDVSWLSSTEALIGLKDRLKTREVAACLKSNQDVTISRYSDHQVLFSEVSSRSSIHRAHKRAFSADVPGSTGHSAEKKTRSSEVSSHVNRTDAAVLTSEVADTKNGKKISSDSFDVPNDW